LNEYNLSLKKENEKLRANILPIDISEKQNRNLLKENKVLQQKLQDSEAYNRKLNEYYELAFRDHFEEKKDFHKSNEKLDEMKKQLELELDETRKRNQEIEAAVEKDKVQLEDGEKWIQTIEHQLNMTVTELIEVEKNLESCQEDNKDLTEERNRLKAAYESLKQNHEIFKKQQEAENATISIAHRIVLAQLKTMSKFIDSMKRTNMNLVQKNCKLEYKVGFVETKFETERRGRCDANEEVDKLQKDLAETRAEVLKEKKRNQQLLRYGMKLKTSQNKSARISVFERLAY